MKIKDLRHEIKGIDEAISALLSKRISLCEKVGLLKKIQKLPVFDPQVESQVIKRFTQSLAPEHEKFGEELAAFLLRYSREIQEKVKG